MRLQTITNNIFELIPTASLTGLVLALIFLNTEIASIGVTSLFCFVPALIGTLILFIRPSLFYISSTPE